MEDDPPPSVPEWIVTYGDMMSLLLTFFIMLVSMSELKKEGDVRALLDSMTENFGNMPDKLSGIPGASLQLNSVYRHLNSEGVRSENGIKKFSSDSIGQTGKHTSVKRINHGQNTAVGGVILFDKDSVELTPEVEKSISVVFKIVQNKPNRIMVRGHTSPEPLPPDSQYKTHMAISHARALTIANFLMSKGIVPERIVISSAGASEPRMLSRSAEDQILNHRVDVFLIESYISPQ